MHSAIVFCFDPMTSNDIDKLIDLGPLNLLDFVFYSIEAKAKKYQIQNPAIKLTLYQIHPTIQNTTHNDLTQIFNDKLHVWVYSEN